MKRIGVLVTVSILASVFAPSTGTATPSPAHAVSGAAVLADGTFLAVDASDVASPVKGTALVWFPGALPVEVTLDCVYIFHGTHPEHVAYANGLTPSGQRIYLWIGVGAGGNIFSQNANVSTSSVATLGCDSAQGFNGIATGRFVFAPTEPGSIPGRG